MINLLPEEIREGITYGKKNQVIVSYMMLEVILGILLVLSFLLTTYFLKSNNSFFLSEREKSQLVIDSYDELFAEAKSLEGRIQSAAQIKQSYSYWSKFNIALNRLTPASVFLGTVEKQESLIKISGYAQSKKDAVFYLDLLKVSNMFSSVDVDSVKEVDNPADPASEIKVQNFNFLLKLQEGALK